MPLLPDPIPDALAVAGHKLARAVGAMHFSPPVVHVYNPLDYAWPPYLRYLELYASSPKSVVFLGMNPGPFGMAQTGVPFGDVGSVKDWLRITAEVGQPINPHPKRPVAGFDCPRSEVSGRRLWGLFASRFGNPNVFFKEHFVLNYCPLAFMEESGKNRTPDKLHPSEREQLFEACNDHLRDVVAALEPEWVVGIGGFAFARAEAVFESQNKIRLAQVLHPSPACPASNKDWAGQVTGQLVALGIWNQET